MNQIKEAWHRIANGALIVDVRSAQEYMTHIEGAINVPYDQIQENLHIFGENKELDIILYCKSGPRADVAKSILEREGYTNVINAGGYEELIRGKPDNS